jgi:hypothetical protein
MEILEIFERILPPDLAESGLTSHYIRPSKVMKTTLTIPQSLSSLFPLNKEISLKKGVFIYIKNPVKVAFLLSEEIARFKHLERFKVMIHHSIMNF